MPVALPGFDESDTNASVIALGFNVYIFRAFDLTPIKPYSSELLAKYLELLDSKRPK